MRFMRLPEALARQYYAIPLYKVGNTLTLATAYPVDPKALAALEEATRISVSPVFSFPDDIQDAIAIQYQSKASLGEFLTRISENALFKGTSKITSQQLQRLAGDQSIVELGNAILLLGVKERASDIHIEPQEDLVRIRFRIDGVLQNRLKIEKALLPPLISAYKVQGRHGHHRTAPAPGRADFPGPDQPGHRFPHVRGPRHLRGEGGPADSGADQYRRGARTAGPRFFQADPSGASGGHRDAQRGLFRHRAPPGRARPPPCSPSSNTSTSRTSIS